MRARRGLLALALMTSALATATAAPAAAASRPKIRLDQIQVLGTHNSYHLPPGSGAFVGDSAKIKQASLTEQLERQNVRSFELDAFNGLTFPVFHSILTDEKSTCPTMQACLEEIDAWSRQNRRHTPITILIEPKSLPHLLDPNIDMVIQKRAAQLVVADWDAAGLDRLDAVVRKTFGKRLLTPDQVRGKYRSLRDAVVDRGWPSLAKSRGKVVVALNTGPPLRGVFLDGHWSLKGRAMFVTADETSASAAVVKRDDPTTPGEIEALLEKHFIVRTRADANGYEPRLDDHTRADRALASGAQIVSTDFPVPDREFGPYVVAFPSGLPARCNPVTAPEGCRSRYLPEH